MLAGSLARCRLFKRNLAGESGGSSMSIMFNLCRVMYKSFVSSTLKCRFRLNSHLDLLKGTVNCLFDGGSQVSPSFSETLTFSREYLSISSIL